MRPLHKHGLKGKKLKTYQPRHEEKSNSLILASFLTQSGWFLKFLSRFMNYAKFSILYS